MMVFRYHGTCNSLYYWLLLLSKTRARIWIYGSDLDPRSACAAARSGGAAARGGGARAASRLGQLACKSSVPREGSSSPSHSQPALQPAPGSPHCIAPPPKTTNRLFTTSAHDHVRADAAAAGSGGSSVMLSPLRCTLIATGIGGSFGLVPYSASACALATAVSRIQKLLT